MHDPATVASFDVEAFFSQDVQAFTKALANLDRRIPAGQIPQDDINLEDLTIAFHQSRDACEAAEVAIGSDTVLLEQVRKRFRDEISPWFDRSWFMERAKFKPRGYPGDYEMLTAIYDGKAKSTGIGGYLDLYFLRTDLARAVCTRLSAIQKFLVREVLNRATKTSILNVASGPGREYSSGFHTAEPVQLTCVDTDEKALEFLKAHVDPTTQDSLDVNCVCYNALKMASAKSNIEKFGQPDIIYSVGLCDYIPDRYLIRILQGWAESVGEDGIVYVAFKDCLKYYPAEYQWHVDWHFYERTEEDCWKLFKDAGYATDEMDMTRDETGIIMNFVARQKAIPHRRFDAAEKLRGPHVRPQSTEVVREFEAEVE